MTFRQVKHWKTVIDDDMESEHDGDFTPDDELMVDDVPNDSNSIPHIASSIPPIRQNADFDPISAHGNVFDSISMPQDDANSDFRNGFYEVEAILQHKYQQGWKFLVEWKNFPVSSATWEPPRHFRYPDGSYNTIFEDYCRRQGIPMPKRGRPTKEEPKLSLSINVYDNVSNIPPQNYTLCNNVEIAASHFGERMAEGYSDKKDECLPINMNMHMNDNLTHLHLSDNVLPSNVQNVSIMNSNVVTSNHESRTLCLQELASCGSQRLLSLYKRGTLADQPFPTGSSLGDDWLC